jgi:hypothetical protein
LPFMDTQSTRRWGGRHLAPVLLGGLLVLAGCGGGQSQQETVAQEVGATVHGDGPSGFGEVVAAVERANITLCASSEGGAYIALPAPPAQAAAAAANFRYLEGRIYEFGPCELPPTRRNELRIFRYAEALSRDAAIQEMARRNTRPTSTFAVGETYEAQIWSPDPSLEGPMGQAAAAVHFSLGSTERIRHLGLGS